MKVVKDINVTITIKKISKVVTFERRRALHLRGNVRRVSKILALLFLTWMLDSQDLAW